MKRAATTSREEAEQRPFVSAEGIGVHALEAMFGMGSTKASQAPEVVKVRHNAILIP
jgi:hypothetical protein